MIHSLYRVAARLGLLGALCMAAMPGAAIARDRHLPRPVPAQRIVAPAPVRPALWKLADADTTIYLFGTVHALPKGVQWLDGKLATAFDQSDSLVTEIIEKSPEQMRPIVAAKAMLPQGQSLRAGLSPKVRARFEAALGKNGLPPAAFDRFQPWYAAVALSTLPVLKSGYDPANGADAILAERARIMGKAHEALETPEYQLGLFGTLPGDLQRRYLKEVVDGMATIPNDLKTMIRYWQTGDAVRLARVMNEDESDPRLTDLLLINRNKNWARWVQARMARPGTVFIAVGAGHLAGKGSLQDQLRAKGYAISRVQ